MAASKTTLYTLYRSANIPLFGSHLKYGDPSVYAYTEGLYLQCSGKQDGEKELVPKVSRVESSRELPSTRKMAKDSCFSARPTAASTTWLPKTNLLQYHQQKYFIKMLEITRVVKTCSSYGQDFELTKLGVVAKMNRIKSTEGFSKSTAAVPQECIQVLNWQLEFEVLSLGSIKDYRDRPQIKQLNC